MGQSYFFQWFGGMKLHELYAIKETQWDTLTQEQRTELEFAISRREKEKELDEKDII